MAKTLYPVTADLAKFLAVSGLLTTTTVSAGATSTSQTLISVSGLQVGDSVYFVTAAATKSVTAINTTTNAITVASTTTVTGEQVIFLPQALDLDSAIAGGIAEFEREVGRKMLALADTTRTFDPPSYIHGMLDLKTDLAAVTSLSAYGSAKTVNTDYRLLPQDAVGDGVPYDRIQFLARWYWPSFWTDNAAISIVGKFGYSSTAIPDDAFRAMLILGAQEILPELAMLATGGLVSWTEAGVSENYGNVPYQGVQTLWKMQVERATMRYRRKTAGI